MRLDDTLLKPIITEKSVAASSDSIYVFKVNMSATKGSITKKLKDIFNVDVIDAKSLVVPGKVKRILKTRRFKKTPSWKKMVVKLKKGQTIDLFPKE